MQGILWLGIKLYGWTQTCFYAVCFDYVLLQFAMTKKALNTVEEDKGENARCKCLTV